jgi:uncharacterized protein
MKQSEIYKLHQKYAVGRKILEIGWTHSLIVKEIAIQLADDLKKKYGIRVDKKLIETGAMVHDIGFYEYFNDYRRIKNNYVEHGEKGWRILLKENFSKNEARFALTHVGVGYKENVPITLEEEIVCYADCFHSKGHPRFNYFEEVLEEMKNRNPDFGVIFNRFKDKFGIPNLKKLEKKHKKWHKEINEWVDSVK